MPSTHAETRNIVFPKSAARSGCCGMNKTKKTEAAGSPATAARFRRSNWRGLVRPFGRNHDPLLTASLTAFNQPRFYFSAGWMPPLRSIVSGL
jgi:hypothetical protein